jgi:hypothetical protein
VKSEDTVLITERGPEVLTGSKRWPHDLVRVAEGAVLRPVLLVSDAG